MKTLTLSVPDNFEIDNKEALLMIASKMYEQGKLSLGQAADVAGLTKKAFIEILNNYNISILKLAQLRLCINYTLQSI
jgi:predicted HTH domain antitoxin